MTKTKSYLLVSIVSVLVLAVGVSFAYFTVQIQGTGKTMSVDTANLRVIFTDTNAAITADAIRPGWTASKTFTVESKTDAEYKYDIVIKNLVNTFVTEGYLQYQIIRGSETVQDWTDIPKSATATDTILVRSVPLAVNAKHTYIVNFRYQNSDSVDQSADMGKSFSGSIMITEGTAVPATLVDKILEDNNATVEANVPQRTASGITTISSNDQEYNASYLNNDLTSGRKPNIIRTVPIEGMDDPDDTCTEDGSFDCTYTSPQTTFFKTNNAEHGETVYYFAGANTSVNNWVIFGTCKSSTYNCTVGHDLYWRIIRTNEETTGGGVRLLYAGSGSKEENGKKVIADNVTNATISTSNTTFSDSSSNKTRRYLGYTFGSADTNLSTIRGTTGQSAVKTLIEQWYAAQFPTSTDSTLRARISTKAVYCNDRSTNSVASTTTSFGSSTISHGAYLRLNNNNSTGRNPSYACGAKITGYDANSTWYYTGGNDNADRYSADGPNENYTFGNGLLKDSSGNKVPVALMTADEIAFAGGTLINSNESLWYYANKEGNSIAGNVYWGTLSPDRSYSSTAAVFSVGGSSSNPGSFSVGGVNNSIHVRPVLSLDSETLWLQGDGSASDPYRIVEN